MEFTPLEEACRVGKLHDVLKLLYQAEVDIHANNEMALFLAARNNQIVIVDLLLQAGAKVRNTRNMLMAACKSGDNTGKIVRILLDAGADVHQEDDLALRIACKRNNIGVVRILLAAGANIHAENEACLFAACHHEDTALLELLVQKGVDIHARNDHALFLACHFSRTGSVRMLLDAGADPYANDERGIRTALLSYDPYLMELFTPIIAARYRRIHEPIVIKWAGKKN